MAYLNEKSKSEISRKKLDILKESIPVLKGKISDITNLNEKTYSVKNVAWDQTVQQIQASLEEDSYFLFIGRFSAGKSSFINKLIGIDILPTASVPCTAIVTEVRFVDGRSTSGKVVYQNGQVDTVLESDLKDMIIGKKTVEGGAIHHLELSLDINKIGDGKDSLKSLVDKVVIVDCPGFDSPYRFSDDILYEYIEKASFTFYMMPSNDFGGFKEVCRLNEIKKKTATLIPIITKSDLIENEESKEEKVELFSSSMAGKFETEVPIFVSSYKYDEYIKLRDSLKESIIMGSITSQQRDDLNSLWMESGISYVYNQIASKAKDSELNEKKIESVLFDFNAIVNELKKASIAEENYWRRELNRIGYNLDSQTYQFLEQNKIAVDSYIDDQSKSVGKELKDTIITELATIDPKAEEHVNTKVQECFGNAFSKIEEKYYPIWKKKFDEYYRVNVETKQIKREDPEIKTPQFNNFPDQHSYIPMGILEGFKRAGIRSILMIALGAVILSSKEQIQDKARWLWPIALIIGVAATIYAVASAVPDIKDALDERKRKTEKETKRAYEELIDSNSNMNFEAIIRSLLNEFKTAYTETFKKTWDKQRNEFEEKYKKSIGIKENLEKIQISLNLQVGD